VTISIMDGRIQSRFHVISSIRGLSRKVGVDDVLLHHSLGIEKRTV
jgi:hypothetical protein